MWPVELVVEFFEDVDFFCKHFGLCVRAVCEIDQFS